MQQLKLHSSVIKEIVRIVETHSGHRGEHRLIEALQNLDLSTYQQNSTGNNVLVLTRELLENTGG